MHSTLSAMVRMTVKHNVDRRRNASKLSAIGSNNGKKVLAPAIYLKMEIYKRDWS